MLGSVRTFKLNALFRLAERGIRSKSFCDMVTGLWGIWGPLEARVDPLPYGPVPQMVNPAERRNRQCTGFSWWDHRFSKMSFLWGFNVPPFECYSGAHMLGDCKGKVGIDLTQLAKWEMGVSVIILSSKGGAIIC